MRSEGDEVAMLRISAHNVDGVSVTGRPLLCELVAQSVWSSTSSMCRADISGSSLGLFVNF